MPEAFRCDSPIRVPLDSQQTIPVYSRELLLVSQHIRERPQDERERRP